MSPLDALRVAFRAIASNVLRSSLTTLGMVIGVGSVIVLIAVGQGAQAGVQSQIRSLGQDLIFITPGAQSGAAGGGARGAAGSAQTLTTADSDAIAAAGLPGVKAVAPQLSLNLQAIVGNSNQEVTVIGTTPNYPQVRDTPVALGRFVDSQDVNTNATSIDLGAAIAKTLFPTNSDPVGQTVRLSFGGRLNLDFTVIGVMQAKGASGGGSLDNYVYTPVSAILGRFRGALVNATGGFPVNQINVETTPNANQQLVQEELTSFLEQRHGVTTPDFTIQSQNSLIGAAGQVSTTLSILLGSIAGISLLVGAIGVMNIMLVSVTERTREIGIRRAVGARGADIMLQFVTEALVLCVGGGVLGIIIGIGIAVGIDNRSIAGHVMSTVVQPWSVIVAFAVAAGIGALAGSYPAFRASKLDPITALRNE